MSDLTHLLSLLASLGAPAQLTAMLAEHANLDLGDADQQRWLAGPLVVHETAWNDTLPQWCRRQALAERWQIVAGELPDHIVGPTEILCVMYGATLVAPLQHDAADLYLWASNHAVVAHFGKKSESAKGAQEVSKHVTDADVLQPGGRLYRDYRQLAFEIRSKVAKACRERIKQEKKIAKAQTKESVVMATVELEQSTFNFE